MITETQKFFLDAVKDGKITVEESGDVYNNVTKHYFGRSKRRGDFKFVSLWDSGAGKSRTIAIHHLVWLVHKGEIPKGKVVALSNRDDKSNIALDNLKLSTLKEENQRYKRPIGAEQHTAKLTAEMVIEARSLYPEQSIQKLAKKYGVAPNSMGCAIHGDSWAHLPGAIPKKDATYHTLTREMVVEDRKAYEEGKTAEELALKRGVHKESMIRALTGRTWSKVPDPVKMRSNGPVKKVKTPAPPKIMAPKKPKVVKPKAMKPRVTKKKRSVHPVIQTKAALFLAKFRGSNHV